MQLRQASEFQLPGASKTWSLTETYFTPLERGRVASERAGSKGRASFAAGKEREAECPQRARATKVNGGLERLAEASFAIWRPRRMDRLNGCSCRFFYLRNATTNFSFSGTCFTVSFIQHPIQVLLE